MAVNATLAALYMKASGLIADRVKLGERAVIEAETRLARHSETDAKTCANLIGESGRG